MKKLLLIGLSFLLLIVGCDDENPELENFSGITEIDADGNVISEDSNDWYGNEYSNAHCIIETTSEGGVNVLPATYTLIPAFPNPFDTLVSIHYGLPTDSNVKMTIIDRNGNPIQVLVNDNQTTGYYCVSWDGKDESGEIVTSELYRLLFYAGDFFAHGDIMYTP